MNRWLRCCLLCVLGLVSACATTQPRQTLYDELGGQAGIEALVETMLSRIADDQRIVDKFARVNIVMLNERLVQKFCHVSDGPCPDTAKSMKQAHAHLAIREGDFNALVEDLNWAMDQRKIPRRTQNRLLAQLAAMHGDIVNH
ncbi:group 1 truncated hemoglobin [Xanthomonas sp. WHRI 8391]|uniref:Group 1 truncated hemoglobin n=1 Tax=Xanthomonas hortorum pv. carotae TaxID=487904 RepID=A0A6V7D2L4_9XANT|nr:group 1 truncated hemoglobin [Xanthomonas hortorum]ETC87642.1 cyanoglobin [Xanthomonas hortorum pv. carotae str. M081]MBG3851806.1 group 1 truncated hemoglobin [Xanthomonas hortorum pv. carotae]UTS72760.1 group 1 truncated hemoglobin [Xanthomonas hortorum]CAD0327182.1 Group 1 truncated hemoglobin GlbN [Xanthomonas hortorum pv. carotae]CAD0327193.1 Group 1 truncated hemoglobin GlbN [Xanthomonas hortorum pv. carotae]